MRDKQKAYEEKMDAQLKKWSAQITLLKTRGEKTRGAFHSAASKFRSTRTNGHAANGHARRLAEAIILQSIEDLWHPVCKKGSLKFFEGDGFALCSEIAGISYIKQLAILRTLAKAGQRANLRHTRRLSEGALTGG